MKNLPANAGDTKDLSLIPVSGRSSGGEHSSSFQYSCLEYPIDRGAWQDTVHGIIESDMTVQLTAHTHTHTHTHTHVVISDGQVVKCI